AADAARLDQRAAELDQRTEATVGVAAEPGHGAIARTAHCWRAMAVPARLVVEDRTEAVGNRVPLREYPRAGVECVDERRRQPVERRSRVRRSLRSDVDGGGVDERSREQNDRGSRAHRLRLPIRQGWRRASYTIPFAVRGSHSRSAARRSI